MAIKHGKEIGALIVILVLFYIYSSISSAWVAMREDLRVVLTMIFFVWILNWARKQLGSPRLAILYALVIAYLVFYKHPEAVWLVLGIFILSIVAPKIFEGLETSGPKKDPFLEALKEAKPQIQITMPAPFPYQQGWPYYSQPPEKK